jgi:hypothetical protein
MARRMTVLSVLFLLSGIAPFGTGPLAPPRALAQVEAQPDAAELPQIDLQADFPQEMTPEEQAAAQAFFVTAVLCYGAFILLVFAVNIFVIYLLYTCFQRIPLQYRLMEPGMVWLLLIPLFNIVWVFFVLIRLSRSYQGYFAAQGRTDVGDCGEALGLWALILHFLCFPVGLVLLIIYLVKVIGLKNQIPVGAVT